MSFSPEKHKEFIKKSYKNYKKIGFVECPAFCNEKIYFNKVGFNHLLWKGKKLRKPEEQVRRISLIPKATEIIGSSIVYLHYRKDIKLLGNGLVSNANFWSLSSKGVRVTIRQTNNGRKCFLSVM